MSTAKILIGNCIESLKTLPDESVQCCVTSPPYWGLRDYGVDGQLGLEDTPQAFVANLVEVFREVRRVLRSDGCLFINLGDSYAANRGYQVTDSKHCDVGNNGPSKVPVGLKPKDLCGIPWRVAFALQDDGWWLRQDIIWCLSGGTWLYVRSQKGDMPMMVRDMARLDPSTVKLWNGKRWTQLLGMNKSARRGDELEITLRSGERISCTQTHKFPTGRGLLNASEICVGDTLKRCHLPEPENTKDCAIDCHAAWFAGLYVAEGSMSGNTIQIAGHAKEGERWKRVQAIAAKYGGTATRTVAGNCMDIRVYGKILTAIVGELVTGKTSKDKGFAPVVWRYSSDFISAMVDGYLSGDGHLDGNRWRLGFCRNYNLERDLRTACARLGYTLTLNKSTTKYDGRLAPTFRGELRKATSGHWNEKDRKEVVSIGKSRCRNVYDIGVADDPHLFALASGILTHNSKPNPMPESVRDRCTKAHEYIFLLTKSARYYWDGGAIAEKSCGRELFGNSRSKGDCEQRQDNDRQDMTLTETRNARSVWTITTKPYSGAHFATFPPELPMKCIKAGTSKKGCCPQCGAPRVRVVERGSPDRKATRGQQKWTNETGQRDSSGGMPIRDTKTTGWEPGCDCSGLNPFDPVPCTVLDPFLGSGTTAAVALKLGRNAIGCELNPEYAQLALKRCKDAAGMFGSVEIVGEQ